MSSTRLTVFVPGLLGPMKGIEQLTRRDWPALPALERLLSVAVRRDDPIVDMHRGLFALFGLEFDADAELPAAQFAYCGDTGTQPDTQYWRADPVHMSVDRERAVLLEHEMLRITAQEAEQLVAAINAHFADDGLHLEAPTPHHWYLRFDKAMALSTTPLSRALHQDVGPYLPQGGDARQWAVWLNEIQMLLFNHPVNLERQAEGAYSINGLWLWGGGQTSQRPQSPYRHVWSDEAVVSGLAAATGTARSSLPVPIDIQQVLADIDKGEGLVMQPHLYPAVNDQDVFEWLSLLQWLEAKYFAPLCKALERRRFAELTLLPCDGRCWRVTSKSLRKWWVRRKPLAHWLATGRA